MQTRLKRLEESTLSLWNKYEIILMPRERSKRRFGEKFLRLCRQYIDFVNTDYVFLLNVIL